MTGEETKSPARRLPKFKSRQEEAEFWDAHSPLDYPDEFTEVKRARVASHLVHTLAVRLDAKTIDRLWAIGQKKGVGASTLARMWLIEKLELEEKAPGSTHPDAKPKAKKSA